MQTSTLRSVFMYTLVALALIAAIVLGIQAVKNRSHTVSANNGQTQNPQPTTPQPQTPPATSTPDPKPAPAPQVSGANTQQPTHVPATGSDDLVVTTLALSSLVAASMFYLQSRRRLVALG